VRVARAGRRQDAFDVRDHGGLGVPGPLVGELRRQRAVDLPRLEPPDQERGHHAPVLALRQDAGVARPGQDDVPVDPDDLLRAARPAEQRDVELLLPLAEPRTGPRTDVTALVAVPAPVWP